MNTCYYYSVGTHSNKPVVRYSKSVNKLKVTLIIRLT